MKYYCGLGAAAGCSLQFAMYEHGNIEERLSKVVGAPAHYIVLFMYLPIYLTSKNKPTNDKIEQRTASDTLIKQ